MKSSRLILLSLIWNACANCRAYDISQPPKPGPSPLPDDPTSNTRRKPWLDLSNTKHGPPTRRRTLVLVSTFCSGAIGACVSSALVPQQQNLVRQWLPVSAAGTLLLVAAAVEGEWVGHAHQWWRQQQQKQRRRQHRVPEVSEVIDHIAHGKQWPYGTTSSRRDDVQTSTRTTTVHNAETATVVEIEPAGGIIYGGYPIQQEQPKRDASSLGSEGSKAYAASSDSADNGWTFPTIDSYSSSSSFSSASNVDGSTSSAYADTSSTTTTRNEDNRSRHGSVVSSDGSAETTRQPKPNHVVADQAPDRKSLVNKQQPKKSHRNLLLFWKKKKQQKEETDGTPPIPPWSHFAQEDNSRTYEEDYGDDSIGEGLGL
jgi:hypothetical protein